MLEANSEKIEKNLKKLVLGLMQNHAVQVYEAHNQLCLIGSNVVPFVESEICKYRWDKINDRYKLNLLSGLLRLVQDIDENEAKRIGTKVCQAGCSAIVSSRVISITSSTKSDFVLVRERGLKVYLSKALENHKVIQAYISKWLAIIPSEDFDQIEQIFVVPESKEDHLGFYVPILRSVQIEWSIPDRRYTPFHWFSALRHQKTLYHEIGHHVHRHTFGQDPEQESEANSYASILMRKDHPLVHALVRSLVKWATKITRKLEIMEKRDQET